MTVLVELTPEMQTRLEREATKRGQGTSVIVAEALEMFLANQGESINTGFADIRGMSQKTLLEYWDNDEDAIYDTL